MPKKRKKHKSTYVRNTIDLELEGRRQCAILYGSTVLALYRHHGKRKDAIRSLFDITNDVWQDCAKDITKSAVRLCEVKTGVEIQCGDGRSWHDIPFLNGSLNISRMTVGKWAYMRKEQIRWIPSQIMACIMIALHRKYKFGFERLSRIYAQIQEIEVEFNDDPERIRTECINLVNIDIHDIYMTEREVKSVV